MPETYNYCIVSLFPIYFFALMYDAKQTSNDFKILFKHYCIIFQILIQNAAAVELSFYYIYNYNVLLTIFFCIKFHL